MWIRAKVPIDYGAYLLTKGQLADLPTAEATHLIADGRAVAIDNERAVREAYGVEQATKSPPAEPIKSNKSKSSKSNAIVADDTADDESDSLV